MFQVGQACFQRVQASINFVGKLLLNHFLVTCGAAGALWQGQGQCVDLVVIIVAVSGPLLTRLITATQYDYDRFQAHDTLANSVSRQMTRVSQALVSLMWTDENLICSSFIIITVKLRRDPVI